MDSILFLPYFGTIEFFHVLNTSEKLIFEIHDTYPKQTYRTRTQILGSNGVLDLFIPVKKPNGSKSKTLDILIDYTENWQKSHVKSIESAYKNSPFFDYYFDDIFQLINQKDLLLIDKNHQILELMLKNLKISKKIQTTEAFLIADDSADFRTCISPKVTSKYRNPEYIQVFSDRFEFEVNLSILDLLFNEGPNAINLLKNV